MLITCIGIFLARACDVALGTLRMIFTVKGKTLIAAGLAFIEVVIWFLVAREALNTDIPLYIVCPFYAGGYATGTLVGTFISNTFVSGLICVQIITKKNNTELIETIRNEGYGISVVALQNDYDLVKKVMLFVEINKKSLNHLTDIVKSIDESAFMMVNETKVVHNGLIK